MQKPKPKPKENLGTDLTPLAKIIPKWTTDLTMKQETLKLLWNKIGEDLADFGLGNSFLGANPKTQSMKENKVDKWIKIQATIWEKIFLKHVLDKGFMSKIYKEFLHLNNQNINNPLKTRAKDLKDTRSH